MREILFRGKQFDSKGWTYGSLILTRSWPMIGALDGRVRSVDPDTVGQYTGLNDKNGKKVFEGDIIRTTLDYQLHIVEYAEDDWYGFIYTSSKDQSCDSLAEFYAEDIEVVGNIHDNPELMEGENNEAN